MNRSSRIRLQAGATAVIAAATAGEAVRVGQPHLALLALLAAAGAIGIVLGAGEPVVSLRSDLAEWVARCSAATGEPERRIVGRAVSRHRDAIESDTRDTSPDAASGAAPGAAR